MGLYKRADSPFWWMLIEASGQKRSTGVRWDAPSVEAKKQQRQLAYGVYLRRSNLAVSQANDLPIPAEDAIAFTSYADWYETHVLAKHRGAERELAALKHLRAFFGAVTVAAITPAAVHEYTSARLATRIGKAPAKGPDARRTITPRTVNREVALLKMMLRAAVPEHLKASPLHGLKMLRVLPRKKMVLEPADEAKLLSVLQPDDRALFIVAIDTLARLSNVLHLKRDEDKGDHLAFTDSKTGPYTVPLSRRARAALDALPEKGAYYFPRRRSTKQPRNTIRLMLKYAAKRAGLTYGRVAGGFTFHTGTRATGATRLLRAGVDPRTIQELGHWGDIRSMQTYFEPDRAAGQSAVNRIGKGVRITRELRRTKKHAKQRAKSA